MKKADILGNRIYKEIYDKAAYLEVVFSEQAEGESQEALENRYKVIVLFLLPVICSRVRAIFFLLTAQLGILLALLFFRF